MIQDRRLTIVYFLASGVFVEFENNSRTCNVSWGGAEEESVVAVLADGEAGDAVAGKALGGGEGNAFKGRILTEKVSKRLAGKDVEEGGDGQP